MPILWKRDHEEHYCNQDFKTLHINFECRQVKQTPFDRIVNFSARERQRNMWRHNGPGFKLKIYDVEFSATDRDFSLCALKPSAATSL